MRHRELALVLLSLVAICAAEYCKLDTKSCTCIADSGYGVDLHDLRGNPIQGVGDAGTQYLLSLCSDSTTDAVIANGTKECQKGYSVSWY